MMRSASAIFIKQVQDILKNKGVLLQAISFPVMAFVLTNFVELPHDIPDTMFISLFAIMFIGLVIISNSATIIAEDRERKCLRFLMMAGVKSHQYLTGIGGVLLLFSLAVGAIFAA
ncbi:MAG: ABC transporter permease, partial [Bacteroidetes bacterium]|nr:ABC transporter permease [Bacteroidota bacterium]